jgi:hypothetical protein
VTPHHIKEGLESSATPLWIPHVLHYIKSYITGWEKFNV